MIDNADAMGKCIKAAKESIGIIIKDFEKKYKKKDLLSFAYVGYSDHYESKEKNKLYDNKNPKSEWDPKYPVKICEFTND